MPRSELEEPLHTGDGDTSGDGDALNAEEPGAAFVSYSLRLAHLLHRGHAPCQLISFQGPLHPLMYEMMMMLLMMMMMMMMPTNHSFIQRTG